MDEQARPKSSVGSSILKALLIFFSALIFFFWFLNNHWAFQNVIAPYTTLVAAVSTSVFKLFGQAATRAGQVVTVDGTSLSIATGCNGAEALALFFSAVFAYPTNWKRKLAGLAIGLAGIFIVNQVRVVGLFVVAMLKPEVLPEAHHYVGQTFVIVLGMALWWLWAQRFAGTPNARNFSDAR